MEQQEISGALANGAHYRATSYLVEIVGPNGETTTIDANEIKEVQRKGQQVTIKRRKGKDVVLEAASLDDAGRLETLLRQRSAVALAAKGGGAGGIFKWGCLGTLAVIVVIVVVAVATSGGDSGSAPKSAAGAGAPTATSAPASAAGSGSQPTAAATKQVGTNKGDVHVPLKEGSSGQVKEASDKIHQVTIVKITDDAKSTNEFEKAQDGNKFWVVEVRVENAGPAEIYLGQWKLRGSNDFEYDPTIAVGLGQPLNPAQNLTSGAKTQGVVVFEIPKDVTPKFLRYDPNVLLKGDLYFDAQ